MSTAIPAGRRVRRSGNAIELELPKDSLYVVLQPANVFRICERVDPDRDSDAAPSAVHHGEMTATGSSPGDRAGLLVGHAEPVYAVAWSPDGKTLATAGFDDTVRLWDAATHQEIRRYEGHTKIVMAVAIAPEREADPLGGNDNTARIWDYPAVGALAKEKTKAGRPARPVTLSGHAGAVYSVAWSPDGKLAATGAADKTARIWDAAKGLPGPVAGRTRRDRLRGRLPSEGRSPRHRRR